MALQLTEVKRKFASVLSQTSHLGLLAGLYSQEKTVLCSVRERVMLMEDRGSHNDKDINLM